MADTQGIYIVPKGAKPRPEDLVMRGDKFQDLSLNWREPQILEVKYASGRVFQFTNFWQSREVENFKFIAEIRLLPSVTGGSLPPT